MALATGAYRRAMSSSAPIPAGALLTRSALISLGFHSRDLASARFRRVFHGYFTAAEAPASLTEICRIAQQEVVPGAVISGPTAAVHYGIRMPYQYAGGVSLLAAGATHGPGGRVIPSSVSPGDVTDPFAAAKNLTADFPTVHCLRGYGSGSVRHGITVHRSRRLASVTWCGLAMSHLYEVLLQLAGDLPLWDMVAAIDSIVAEDALLPGASIGRILAYADRAVNIPGRHALKKAALLAREKVESSGETYARLLITAAGFPEPVPNVEIMIPATGRTRRADGGWEAGKVGFEYDGSWRRLTLDQWRADEARRDDIASAGWVERRMTRADLREPIPFLLKLRTTLLQRGVEVPGEDAIRRAVARLRTERPAMSYRSRSAGR